jgi:signal peptidase I
MTSDSLSSPPFIPVWGRGNENIYFIYNGISMAPLFKPGDMLCVESSLFIDIRLGDIIVFYVKTGNNESLSVVHRVISISENGLITKGDNNAMVDASVVTINNFAGLVTSFERQGRLYPIKGGLRGLLQARVIHARNLILILINRLGWRTYRLIRLSGFVAMVWRPVISQIRLKTEKGPLIKYCFGTKTVANWWPMIKRFEVIKPFDLVISNPMEQKENADLD